MSFDFSTRDSSEAASKGTPVFLMDPASPNLSKPLVDKDGNQPTIVIMGGDAPKVREKTHETLDAYRERLKKGIEGGRSEQDEKDLINRLAAATVDWSHIAIDGKDLPCTEANARKFYTRFIWVAEQLAKVIDDRAVFFTAGSTS